MKKKLATAIALASFSSPFLVVAVESPAMADTVRCNQYGSGEACIIEVPSSSSGGTMIISRFVNNKGDGNNVTVEQWAVDKNFWIGSNPTTGYTWVPVNGTLSYNSNGLAYSGNCHTYQTEVWLENGTELLSPTLKYCFT